MHVYIILLDNDDSKSPYYSVIARLVYAYYIVATYVVLCIYVYIRSLMFVYTYLQYTVLLHIN